MSCLNTHIVGVQVNLQQGISAAFESMMLTYLERSSSIALTRGNAFSQFWSYWHFKKRRRVEKMRRRDIVKINESHPRLLPSLSLWRFAPRCRGNFRRCYLWCDQVCQLLKGCYRHHVEKLLYSFTVLWYLDKINKIFYILWRWSMAKSYLCISSYTLAKRRDGASVQHNADN